MLTQNAMYCTGVAKIAMHAYRLLLFVIHVPLLTFLCLGPARSRVMVCLIIFFITQKLIILIAFSSKCIVQFTCSTFGPLSASRSIRALFSVIQDFELVGITLIPLAFSSYNENVCAKSSTEEDDNGQSAIYPNLCSLRNAKGWKVVR